MKFEKLNSVYTDLREYCHHAKPGEVIQVTDWSNGEGWDITLGNKTLQLTYGEFEAISVLTKIVHPK
jgi:hypothetical protein